MSTGHRRPSALPALLVFAAALALYGATAAPDVLWGDSAAFQASAAEADLDLGSRSYPLYDLLTWAAGALLPFGTLALRVTLVSALFGAAAVALVFVALRRLGASSLAALGCAAALAVSHGLWSQSVVAEVYSLHVFLVAALLALVSSPERLSARRILAFGAILGLAWFHHRTFLLLYPACLVFAATRRREFFRDRRITAATAAGAFLALAPGVLVLLRSGLEIGASSGASDPGLLPRLTYMGKFLLLDFPSPALLLIALGLPAARRLGAPLVFCLVAVATHVLVLLLSRWFGDLHVFLLPVFVLATPFAATGLDAVRSRRPGLAGCTAVSLLVLPVVAYLGLAAYFSRPDSPDLFRASPVYHRLFFLPPKCSYHHPREFCETVLAELPEKARVMTGWAEGNTLLYLQRIEGRRPDVEVLISDSASRRRRALDQGVDRLYLTRFPYFAADRPPPRLPAGYRLEGEGYLLSVVRE